MPAVIAAADTDCGLARTCADAGGDHRLDQTAARAYAELPVTITGEAPTVVLSDDKVLGPTAAPAEGTALAGGGADGVEGVDVPRLAVGVYATSASTPLFFAQAIGAVRPLAAPRRDGLHLPPSVPNLLLLASEMEAQRNHVLGKPPNCEELEDPSTWSWPRRSATSRASRKRASNTSAPMPNWIR